jgi:hypothetical protein
MCQVKTVVNANITERIECLSIQKSGSQVVKGTM